MQRLSMNAYSSLTRFGGNSRSVLLSSVKIGLVLLACARPIQAAPPCSYADISLLVRMHEPQKDIMSFVWQRRMTRPLERSEEAALRAQGAPTSLLEALRNPALVLSTSETAAHDLRRDAQPGAQGVLEPIGEAITTQASLRECRNKARRPLEPIAESLADTSFIQTDLSPTKEDFEIFHTALGEPISLNNSVGTSNEIRFLPRGLRVIAVRGRPAFIDPHLRASGPEPDLSKALDFYASNQIIAFERNQPLVVSGLPILYPVRETSNGSLYFISTGPGNSLTLAMRTPRR